MCSPHPSRVPAAHRGRVALAVAAAVLVLLATGCSTSSSPAAHPASPAVTGALPSAHVHGVAIDPVDGTLLLATHDGLFGVADDGAVTPVGPVIDLMGFTVAGDRYLASGHPGPGVDLPNPVGLVESRDGGRTWTSVSRAGESDFHTLTAGAAGVLGYDGTLRRSTDGRTWEQLTIPAAPHTLAAAPDGRQVLATTEQGLLRSTDAGSSWSLVEGAPLLQTTAWADATTAVGVEPDGAVWTSTDGAVTWQRFEQLGSPSQAVAATTGGGTLRIAVMTAEALLESTDGGRSFAVVLGH